VETPSSTSSSEPADRVSSSAAAVAPFWRRDLPWGLIGALLLLGCAELVLRVNHPDGSVPYGMKEQAYRSIPHELDRTGAGTVSILGSSRAREGVSMPTLASMLRGPAGRPVRVGNYALTGGRAEEVRFLASKLVAASPAPGLVLYGVGPRQLLPNAQPYQKFSHMWRLADWWRVRAARGAEVAPYFGRAARNSLGRWFYLVRYEQAIREALFSKKWRWWRLLRVVTRTRGLDRSPIRGGPTVWHRRKPGHSMYPVEEEVREYIRLVTAGEPYRLQRQQLDYMGDTISTLSRAGIDVVLFEVPMSPALRYVFSGEVELEFHGLMMELARQHSVPYVRMRDLGLVLSQQEFREQSHANRVGANKLTRALTTQVVLPWMRREGLVSSP